ncbi:glycosyl hydrolase family 95 catalytic domain-containing protein [Bacteroides oleiciplenus]|uniref:Glycoside hydrolase family 95 protein n=1 Tax=Bacteroides oleiciplenus TaxID=626931 RepID=A0A3E5BP61_9BACE|nr:glycoside hydrolase N-terminal domain-containing protein [Bacteroides oleiciplenus]RGN39407.1 glycoside hydrolase family 95 protein [Bacteroides oleiciplenus]
MWNKKILYSALVCIASLGAYAQPVIRQAHSNRFPTTYTKWQEALLAGNGKMGIMVFGNPLHETVVFTDRSFNFPGAKPRTFAEVPRDTLDLIKKYCATGKFKEANDLAVRTSHWRDGGEGGRHPGFALKIDMDASGEIKDYSRISNYETGEITVRWSDARGEWERRSFVSRDANVSVFELQAPSAGKLNCAVSLQMPAEMNFPKGMKMNCLHAEDYLNIRVNYAPPMDAEGYEGGIRVKQSGGSCFLRNDTLYIQDASKVLLLARTEKYAPDCAAEWDKGLLKEALNKIKPDYKALVKAHKAIHAAIFNRVKMDLGASPAERLLSNEELLEKQKQTDSPVLALWERIFDAGRYHFLSSGNELTPPDLLGIWTGDCNAGWGGYYHLDANLNLQVSGGNTGAMPEVMEGYFHLNEVWRKDFETNAFKLLGCRGMLACGNTPGLSSGLMASINDFYPYHYATGEEAWLLYPFWEHYLITEDKAFLQNRLYPLLKCMGEFYEDFLKYKDDEGYYIIAGSVSPENQPSNLRVSLLNNSAFDLSGARFILSTLVKVCDLLGEEQGTGGGKQRWKHLLDSLPPYRINEDGAIKEWGWPGLAESYNHRHSSHLMMVWPYREFSEDKTPELYKAAHRALQMRDRHNYENAGHGYLHAALIAAGLHDTSSLKNKLLTLTQKDFYYNSLSTAHYPNFGTFCTDVCHAVPGVLIEMLVGSDEEGIELLPALVAGIERGSISGIKARCGVTVEQLSWNLSDNKVYATLYSAKDRKIKLKLGQSYDEIISLRGGKAKKVIINYQ